MNVSAPGVLAAPRHRFESTVEALAALAQQPAGAWPAHPGVDAPVVPGGPAPSQAVARPSVDAPIVPVGLAVPRVAVAKCDPCPAVPPVPAPNYAWDGVVRAARTSTRTVPWDAAALRACLRAHAGTPLAGPLGEVQADMAARAPAGLELSHLESGCQGSWPGCSLWMGEPLAQGTSGALRLGYLNYPVGDWPAGLVAVKAMRTRPDLEDLELAWADDGLDAAGAPGPQAQEQAAAPAQVPCLDAPLSPFAQAAVGAPEPTGCPEALVSPFAQAAQAAPASDDRSPRSTQARKRLRPAGASTSECHPKRIAEEAACQRTYSPQKLPVLALLHDETTGMHYLIMRWMRGGSLHHARLDQDGQQHVPALARLTLQSIAHDLNRLSPAGMPPEERVHFPAGLAHDDVKPLNFFFDQDTVALGDWDVDRQSHEPGHIPRTGTPRYMAPERFPFGAPSVAADMWSLGVSLVELFSRKACPFAQARIEQPSEGRAAHERFEAFHQALFADLPPGGLQVRDLAPRLKALRAKHAAVVDWLRPMLQADPRLCLFVLQHLLHPRAEHRLTPQQVLARRDEILPSHCAGKTQALRAHLTQLQSSLRGPTSRRKVFLEHVLPQWARQHA